MCACLPLCVYVCEAFVAVSSTYNSPSVLYCTVPYCTVLHSTVHYCTVPYCSVLYCTLLYTAVLYHIVLYCIALHSTVHCCTVPYCTVLYCTVLHCTLLYCTVLYSTVIYSVGVRIEKQVMGQFGCYSFLRLTLTVFPVERIQGYPWSVYLAAVEWRCSQGICK